MINMPLREMNELSPITLLSLIQRVTVTESETLSQLTPREEDRFREFLKAFTQELTSNRVHLLFRGEKNAVLRQRLLGKNEKSEGEKIFSRIFFFGDKAKNYAESKDSSESRRFWKIDETGQRIFDEIFNRFNSLFSSDPTLEVRLFAINEPQFAEFFRDRSHAQAFTKNCLNLGESVRLEVRDYFLYLLHTIGVASNQSLFVSTSKEIRVAKSFALARKKQEALIVYYWVPDRLSSTIMNVDRVSAISKKLPGLNMTPYVHDAYPHQFETSVKGALFPHFILGCLDLVKDQFVINPHLLADERAFHEIIEFGTMIDQRTFEQRLQATGYRGAIDSQAGGLIDIFRR